MIVKRFVLCAAMVMVIFTNHYLAAQDFNLTYTTEFQTDFRKGAKWVNLLRTDFLQSLGNSVNIEVASISVARTSDKKLVDDLQVYSNIEEEKFASGFSHIRDKLACRGFFSFLLEYGI